MSERTIHLASERGSADHGWLVAKHSFSFGSYYNPRRLGHGALKVINDDQISAGKGFGNHPHRNMEIVTIPLFGAVEHRDSEGNAGMIAAGEIQVMSAGRGISHSEFNPSQESSLRLLQIWIEPETLDGEPRYQQTNFEYKNGATLLVGPAGSDGLDIRQDAFLSMIDLRAEQSFAYNHFRPGHGVYLFNIAGQVAIDGVTLSDRDALAFTQVEQLSDLQALTDVKLLLFELPMKL